MKLQRLLQSPGKIFLLCFIFAFCSLLLNGGWLNLYSMKRDKVELQSQIQRLRKNVGELDLQVKRAKDPTFIERQALDQLDMASSHDLVFVFSE